MRNNAYAKILAGVIVLLLGSATVGGWKLAMDVSAMGEAIAGLRGDFKEFGARLLYVERELGSDD